MKVKTMIAAAVLVGCVAAAPANADVLVSHGPETISCGEQIEVGVWYQSYSGGPRWATIEIRTASKRTVLARKNVTATTRWRNWYFDPPTCGARYRVRYIVPGGQVNYTVWVRQ